MSTGALRYARFRSKKAAAVSLTYLDKREIDALLAMPDQTSSQGFRDHALLLFFYNSGARASEVAPLTIGDIDWHSKSARITGKGDRERHCPLWPTTMRQLRRLAGQRPAEEHLFLNGIHALIERYGEKLRATMPSLKKKRVSPHVDRHASLMGGS
jgi:integrase/recombinase XerD